MFVKFIAFVSGLLLVGGSAVFAGKTHKVIQKGKEFSTATLSVAVGDSVEFANEDTVVHNVFSLSEATKFDLKTQAPGKSSTIKFDKPGEGEVRCAIHPNMKLKLTVK